MARITFFVVNRFIKFIAEKNNKFDRDPFCILYQYRLVISILIHDLWSGVVGIIHYRLHVVVTKGNIYEASYNLKIIESSII